MKTEMDLVRPGRCKGENMNENNNINNSLNKPELKIKSYKIESNHGDENTYSVEIETSAHTIVYPRAIVAFGINQAIAFPVGIQIIDDENNVMFNYSLNIQSEQSEEVTAQSN